MQYVCGRMSRAAQKRNPGRGSLFLPLAAVVAAAQGLFPRRTVRRADAVRIHPCIPFSRQIKQKLRYPLDTGVLGGRGWMSRAALLKTAHWAVFALSSATATQLFESTRSISLTSSQNKNLSVLYTLRFFGGRGWIRTTEAESSRFTVCPHWPLGNTPIFILQSCGLPVYVTTESAICQPIIWAGRKKRRNKGRDHKSPPARVRFTASGGRAFQPDKNRSGENHFWFFM